MIAALACRLPFFYGWLVVAVVFVTMAVGVNARTAFSLLVPPILEEFHWNRGATAGAFSFGFLVSAFLSPAIGRLMDRKGPVWVMELGALALAAGMMLATYSSERVTSHRVAMHRGCARAYTAFCTRRSRRCTSSNRYPATGWIGQA